MFFILYPVYDSIINKINKLHFTVGKFHKLLSLQLQFFSEIWPAVVRSVGRLSSVFSSTNPRYHSPRLVVGRSYFTCNMHLLTVNNYWDYTILLQTYTVALVVVQMISGVAVTPVTALTVLTRVFTTTIIHWTLVLIYSVQAHIMVTWQGRCPWWNDLNAIHASQNLFQMF